VTILLLQRGEHDIEHELTFPEHDGYVFHDSRGFEAGNETELEIVQDFVGRRLQERRLVDRLHAIWFAPFGVCDCKFTSVPFNFRYCVPMDNARPSLDLKHFDDVCPDKNGASKHIMSRGRGDRLERCFLVPVIAVFTKYDQFRRDTGFKLEDRNCDPALVNTEVERIFQEEYLANLRGSAPFVRLASENFVNKQASTTLILPHRDAQGRPTVYRTC
jgi:hypothetical protein